jgi:hypothetical protein
MEKTGSRQAVIDAFGEADRQAKLWTPPVNPHLAKVAELQAIIESWYKDSDAEFCGIEDGQRYRLEVSARRNQREMTSSVQRKAYEAISALKGVDAFSVFEATQEAIKEHLGEAWLDRQAPHKRTGKRKYTVVGLSAPAKVVKKAA